MPTPARLLRPHAPRRHHWDPRRPLPSLPSDAVKVLSVVVDPETGVVTWTFSSPVVAIVDVVGLLCNGEQASGPAITPAGAIETPYADPVAAGDPWSMETSYLDLTFASGGTLQPASGIVG